MAIFGIALPRRSEHLVGRFAGGTPKAETPATLGNRPPRVETCGRNQNYDERTQRYAALGGRSRITKRTTKDEPEGAADSDFATRKGSEEARRQGLQAQGGKNIALTGMNAAPAVSGRGVASRATPVIMSGLRPDRGQECGEGIARTAQAAGAKGAERRAWLGRKTVENRTT